MSEGAIVNRRVTNQGLKRLEKVKAAERRARAELEAAQRAFDEEVTAAGHRADKAALEEKERSRKSRNHELFRVGGIAAKVGLTGLDEHVLEGLFLDGRRRLDCGEKPELAPAALVQQAGLGKESPEVILGILMRGTTVLHEPGRRDQFEQKGRQKLQELEEQRNRNQRQKPVHADPVDLPPMKVKFSEQPSAELRADLKRLGMKYLSAERAWRGSNELATAVRSAIRAAKETHLVAYPADWRGD